MIEFNCEPLCTVQVCQLLAGGFVKDENEREAMWEQQHELAAHNTPSALSSPPRKM